MFEYLCRNGIYHCPYSLLNFFAFIFVFIHYPCFIYYFTSHMILLWNSVFLILLKYFFAVIFHRRHILYTVLLYYALPLFPNNKDKGYVDLLAIAWIHLNAHICLAWITPRSLGIELGSGWLSVCGRKVSVFWSNQMSFTSNLVFPIGSNYTEVKWRDVACYANVHKTRYKTFLLT